MHTMRCLIALRQGRRHPNHENKQLPTSLELERILRKQNESPRSLHVKYIGSKCIGYGSTVTRFTSNVSERFMDSQLQKRRRKKQRLTMFFTCERIYISDMKTQDGVAIINREDVVDFRCHGTHSNVFGLMFQVPTSGRFYFTMYKASIENHCVENTEVVAAYEATAPIIPEWVCPIQPSSVDDVVAMMEMERQREEKKECLTPVTEEGNEANESEVSSNVTLKPKAEEEEEVSVSTVKAEVDDTSSAATTKSEVEQVSSAMRMDLHTDEKHEDSPVTILELETEEPNEDNDQDVSSTTIVELQSEDKNKVSSMELATKDTSSDVTDLDLEAENKDEVSSAVAMEATMEPEAGDTFSIITAADKNEVTSVTTVAIEATWELAEEGVPSVKTVDLEATMGPAGGAVSSVMAADLETKDSEVLKTQEEKKEVVEEIKVDEKGEVCTATGVPEASETDVIAFKQQITKEDQSVNTNDEVSVDSTTDAVPRSSSAQSRKPNQCSSYLFNVSPTDIKVQSYPSALHVRYRPANHHIDPKIKAIIQELNSSLTDARERRRARIHPKILSIVEKLEEAGI